MPIRRRDEVEIKDKIRDLYKRVENMYIELRVIYMDLVSLNSSIDEEEEHEE